MLVVEGQCWKNHFWSTLKNVNEFVTRLHVNVGLTFLIQGTIRDHGLLQCATLVCMSRGLGKIPRCGFLSRTS